MYNVSNLGNIGVIYDINNSGQMTGKSLQTARKAILYSAGQVTVLPNVGPASWFATSQFPGIESGPATCWGTAINSNSDVAGIGIVLQQYGDGRRAFLFSQGDPQLEDLHGNLALPNPLNYQWTTALDVSDPDPSGSINVVGLGDQGPWLITRTKNRQQFKVFCLCKTLTGLPTLQYSVNGVFYDSIRINNQGQMAISSDGNLFLCDLKLKKAVPQNQFFGQVLAFNESRQVLVVNSNKLSLLTPNGKSANTWMECQYESKDIGLAPGNYLSSKRLLNNNGSVGCATQGTDGTGAALWTNGVRVDLNKAVLAYPGKRLNLSLVLGINDSGQIVCTDGSDEAVGFNTILLTPTEHLASGHH